MRSYLCLVLVVCVAAYSPFPRADPDNFHAGGPVTGLPGSSGINDTMYAGYITVDSKHNAQLFYWLMESREAPWDAPLVLWMTGGPGCSSELAVLFENGPFTTDGTTLTTNPYSWNNIANVLYIDQPYGTGFSHANGDYVTDEHIMAEDMYAFLQLFFTAYPHYQGRDFYITGESFGGHYIPALASRIVQENMNSGSTQIKLVAVAIGDGWTNPPIQYGAYGPYGYQNKLITTTEYKKINETLKTCLEEINSSPSSAENNCDEIMDMVIGNKDLNPYNIDEKCVGNTGLCYDFNPQTQYMNNAQTQKALGVKATWGVCQPADINGTDMVSSFAWNLVVALDNGVSVLAYYGELDLICNYIGGYMWTNALVWSGKAAFNAATMNSWEVNGAQAGTTKTANNFAWLQVIGAGHMVPHDQPQAALAMFTQFLNGDIFNANKA